MFGWEKSETPHVVSDNLRNGWRSFACRNRNCEFRALVGLAGNLRFAAVGADDGADETQAETEAALGATLIAAIQPVPDFPLFRQRNAHAVVANADDDAPIF